MMNIGYDTWSRFSPESFEHFCYHVLKVQNPESRIVKTPLIRDGGVDILLESDSDHVKLFSSSIEGASRLMCEVKRRKRTDIHNFARSLVKSAADEGAQCFVLITTAEINLTTYFEVKKFCKQSRLKFAYISNENLTSFLVKNLQIAEHYGFDKVESNWSDLVNSRRPELFCYWDYYKATYQNNTYLKSLIHKGKEKREISLRQSDRLAIPVVLNNYSVKPKEIEVNVIANDAWRVIESDSKNWVLNPNSARSTEFTFELEKKSLVRLPQVELEEVSDPENATSYFRLVIKAENLYALPHFIVPFSGISARKNKLKLVSWSKENLISDNSDKSWFKWMLIEGQAGVGKSRLVEEALLTDDSSHNVRFYIEQKDSGSIVIQVLKYLANNASNLVFKQQIELLIDTAIVEGFNQVNIKAAADLLINNVPLEPLTIIIEDIHHGGEVYYSWITHLYELTKAKKASITHIRFCITGRNDETFPNPFQKILTENFRKEYKQNGIKNVNIINVDTLSTEDTNVLISSIFNGITKSALNKIQHLSENVPFNVLQIIEYLTEESLVEINARNSYSIINEDAFYRKVGTPKSIDELFALRLKNLRMVEGGAKSISLLKSLTFFGFQLSANDFEKLIGVFDAHEEQSMLFDRGYIQTTVEGIRFRHENILHFLNKNVEENSSEYKALANVIFHTDGILGSLEVWRRCYLAYSAKEYDFVLKVLRDTIDDGSVSSLFKGDQLSEKHTILTLGIKVLERVLSTKEEAQLLLNSHCLKAFASKYTKNYFDTIEDGLQTIIELEGNDKMQELLSTETFDIGCATVEQIVGHAYQNAGYLEASHEHVVRAQQITFLYQSSTNEYLDLKFDVEDRLRKNFIYFGRKLDAARSFQIALKTIETKKDNLLLGSAKYGEAELYYLQDPNRAFEVWKSISDQVNLHSDVRTQITHELALIQCRLLTSVGDQELKLQLDNLKRLGDDSIKNGLIGPMPKINLLNAYIYLKLGDYDNAISENLLSYEKAERFGYGIFLWMSMNNLALSYQAKESIDHEKVIQAFETALDKAEKQGFLRHLTSNTPMFFQNALIQNIIKYFERHDLEKQLRLLEKRLIRNNCKLDQISSVSSAHELFQIKDIGIYFLFI